MSKYCRRDGQCKWQNSGKVNQLKKNSKKLVFIKQWLIVMTVIYWQRLKGPAVLPARLACALYKIIIIAAARGPDVWWQWDLLQKFCLIWYILDIFYAISASSCMFVSQPNKAAWTGEDVRRRSGSRCVKRGLKSHLVESELTSAYFCCRSIDFLDFASWPDHYHKFVFPHTRNEENSKFFPPTLNTVLLHNKCCAGIDTGSVSETIAVLG